VYRGAFDAALPVVLTIASSDIVEVISFRCGQVTPHMSSISQIRRGNWQGADANHNRFAGLANRLVAASRARREGENCTAV
jgi:hypothetical protein